MLSKFQTLLRHRWLDVAHTRRVLTPAMVQRLTQRVTASEHRHLGEVQICVEASLPLSYLWRHAWHQQPLSELVRQRALSLFGTLGVWNTHHNNGVLIYLLLAERSIEVVADRGLNQAVAPGLWQSILGGLASELQAGHFERGLTLALDQVSTLLESHFPAPSGLSRANELANAPVLL